MSVACERCRLGKHRECVNAHCDCWHYDAAVRAESIARIERNLHILLRADPDAALDLLNECRKKTI